ncbi:TPA: VENN motif pre-toxin domain-containing protein, partial [Escherichia coli]|nr:VENN motif pre-toxin domain-containing protein [Escherichia coli]
IAGLSRDPENANGSIAPIFDREKEQKRLQEAQIISQISGQMSNIVMTYGETEAMKAARAKHPGLSDAQLRETPEYREVMKGYGTGSTPQMVVQAITGVLGGLNAGNPGQALAGGLNPAVAQLIKQATGDNREANLMAHAVWGALAAQLGGNNAASGAAGAFSGELAARYIIDNYYGGRTDNLGEQERQQISMLVTIASGIAGGLAGNSTSAASAGAQAGRNAVENNLLGGSEWLQTEKAREHGADVLSCSDNPSGEACKRGQAENKAYAAALATSSVSLLSRSAQAMWALGAGANAGIGSMVDSSVDPENAIIAGWVNVITMGQGWKGTVGWNAAGGALGNWIDDKDPLSGALINGTGSGIGYGLGKGLSWGVNAGANWWKGGWDPKFNSELRSVTEVKGDYGLSKEMKPSKVPSSFGDVGGSAFSEITGKGIEKISSSNANGDKK